MLHDPIVEEVRKYRDAYAKRFNYDLRAISRDLQTQQKKSDQRKVSLPPKPVKTAPVAQH
jgi:cytochrome b involved in lipid metabolism